VSRTTCFTKGARENEKVVFFGFFTQEGKKKKRKGRNRPIHKAQQHFGPHGSFCPTIKGLRQEKKGGKKGEKGGKKGDKPNPVLSTIKFDQKGVKKTNRVFVFCGEGGGKGRKRSFVYTQKKKGSNREKHQARLQGELKQHMNRENEKKT